MPYTPSLAGYQATSAKGAANGYGSLDASARQPFAEMPALVGCRVTMAANQTLTTAIETKLGFDVETFDSDGFHDNVTNNTRITIPSGKGGKYRVSFFVYFSDVSVTNRRQAQLLKNNAVLTNYLVRSPAETVGETALQFSDIFVLAAADYLEVRAYQNSGENLDVRGGATWSSFTVEYLGQ